MKKLMVFSFICGMFSASCSVFPEFQYVFGASEDQGEVERDKE